METVSKSVRTTESTVLEETLRGKLMRLIPPDARAAAAPGNRKRPLIFAWSAACLLAVGYLGVQVASRTSETQDVESQRIVKHQGSVITASPSAPTSWTKGSQQLADAAKRPMAFADNGLAAGTLRMAKHRTDSFNGSLLERMKPATTGEAFSAAANPQVQYRAVTRREAPTNGGEPSAASPDRQIHREGEISVAVDQIEKSSDTVEQWTKETAGGYVANSELTTGDDGTRSATLTVKVPETEFYDFIKKVAGLGSVSSKHVSGEDLTERVSDTGQEKKSLQAQIDEMVAQIASARNHWERQEFRDNARDLKVRLAQSQARLEMLKKLATLATVSVELHDKPKIEKAKPAGGIMDDFSDTLSAAGQSILAIGRLPLTLMIWIVAYAPLWILLTVAYRYIVRV